MHKEYDANIYDLNFDEYTINRQFAVSLGEWSPATVLRINEDAHFDLVQTAESLLEISMSIEQT